MVVAATVTVILVVASLVVVATVRSMFYFHTASKGSRFHSAIMITVPQKLVLPSHVYAVVSLGAVSAAVHFGVWRGDDTRP